MENGMITWETMSKDRITELPVRVKHQILSFLSIKEAALTSLLSKAWREEWLRIQSLDLGQQFFQQNFNEESSHLFSAYIDRLFLRRRQEIKQGNSTSFLHRLSLHVPSSPNNSRLDWWLSYAFGVFNVKELEINSELTEPVVGFAAKHLKVLSLSSIILDQKKLDILAANCQLLESLRFHGCDSLRSLKVVGFQKLVQLRILSSFSGKRFEVSDGNLQLFMYDSEKGCVINVANCPGLRSLKICGGVLTDEALRRHLYHLTNLEDLYLANCSRLSNIQISSPKLKHVTLRDVDDIIVVQLTACNLKTFTLSYRVDYPPSLLIHDFSSEYTTVCAEFPCSKSLWKVEVAQFIRQIDQHSRHFRMNAVVKEWDISVTRHMKRKDLPPLQYVKNLVLCTSETQFDGEFVDALSWVFPHSERILIKPIVRPLKGLKFMLKFKYKEKVDFHVLRGQCKSMECWRHCLQQVTIVNIKGAEEYIAPLRDFLQGTLNDNQEIVFPCLSSFTPNNSSSI